MIDRLMATLKYTETIHKEFDYSKAHEGKSQHLYNEGIIRGMKNGLLAAMHHSETLRDKQVYAKLISELNHKEDGHRIDVAANNFDYVHDEIESEGILSGYVFMVSVVRGYVTNEPFQESHVLRLTM